MRIQNCEKAVPWILGLSLGCSEGAYWESKICREMVPQNPCAFQCSPGLKVIIETCNVTEAQSLVQLFNNLLIPIGKKLYEV